MNRAPAPAKINLALIVGPTRDDGKHEIITVLQRIDLCDRIAVAPEAGLHVDGFAEDSIVADALRQLAEAARVEPQWRVTIDKQVPVAAGLGGGSSDAATALRLANAMLAEPLPEADLEEVARAVGSDVPFFLAAGPQLGRGDGSEMTPLDLPQDYFVVIVLPRVAQKASTPAVYAAFDREAGFEERRAALLDSLARVRRPRDLAALPPNDLAASAVADELRALGAFRADVSGAGPTVYGLFHQRETARAVAAAMRGRGRVWITVPAWYG